MLFNSTQFFTFLPLALPEYWTVPECYKNAFLTALFDAQPGVVQLDRENPVFTVDQGYDDKDHVGPRGRRYLSDYYARRLKERMSPPWSQP
jgi:hypothetical protein